MTSLTRLMWKEYRVLRGFWLALAGFGLFIDALFFLLTDSHDRLAGFVGLAGALPAGFAFGAGAILFALEQEESTRDLLRVIPVTPMPVFASKVLTAVSGTVLLSLLLLSVTIVDWGFIRAGVAETITGALFLTLIYALLVMQAMGWSVFFSLRSASPLLAAFMGALGAALCIGLVHFATERVGLYRPDRSGWAPILHVVATVSIWLIDLWLASRWLHDRHATPRTADVKSVRSATQKRLFWQSWRRSSRLLATLVILGVLVTVIFWPAFVLVTGLPFALAGCCTFLADQEGRQFRFFAERGVPAGRVWINRQLFWAGTAILLAAILFVVHRLALRFLIPLSDMPEQVRSLWSRYEWVFAADRYPLWVGLAFGAGQFCSMAVRSGIVAAAVGVLLAVLLLAWAVLMQALAIAFWWSVAPLVVALFAASWLRCDGWLLERNSLRAWLPPALALFVPVVCVLTLVPVYRVWEVPVSEVAIDVPSMSRAPVSDAARRFLAACERVPLSLGQNDLPSLADPGNAAPTEADKRWLEDNGRALDEVLETLSQLPTDATIWGDTTYRAINWSQLATAMLRSGQLAEDDSRLDTKLATAWQFYRGAFRLAEVVRHDDGYLGELTGDEIERAAATQLPRWGARPGQTVERLRSAIAELRLIEDRQASLADVVRREYADSLQWIDGAQANPGQSGEPAVLVAGWAPWEFARVRRLLHYTYGLYLLDSQDADAALAGHNDPSAYSPRGPQLYQADLYWRTSFLQAAPAGGLPDCRRVAVCYRRAAALALAIEAWRLEHSEMPRTFDQLEGAYFEEVPLDPYSNRAFLWFPFGWNDSVRTPNVSLIPAGTPLIFSPGHLGSINSHEEATLNRLHRRNAQDPVRESRAGHPAAAMPIEASGAAGTGRASQLVGMPGEAVQGLAFPMPIVEP
ncbi:MAG TPA: hypothetical protein VHC22_25735 [Pirellulales bacterium]|nr:hypothetical protein [Pirellulales bacterium]